MVGFLGLIFGPVGASGSAAGAAVAAGVAGGVADAAAGAAGVGVSGVASVIRFAPVHLRSQPQKQSQKI